MPELAEVAAYCELAQRVVGRRIAGVETPDAWYLKAGLTPASAGVLVGCRITAARRIGKVLLLDTTGPVIGLRFGMSGRLVVDGVAGVDALLYSSNAAHARFDRFGLRFARGGTLVMRDPRRLGGVSLDLDEQSLGPDALHVSLRDLRAALDGTDVALKTRIMDQRVLAGVGNLTADEVLWRAGLAPARRSGELSDAEVKRLATVLRTTAADLVRRGGSHAGDLMPARVRGGRCPRDGAELVRSTIGGRTTWACPTHQR